MNSIMAASYLRPGIIFGQALVLGYINGKYLAGKNTRDSHPN